MRYLGLVCWLMVVVSYAYGNPVPALPASEDECAICLESFDEKPVLKLKCDSDRKIDHIFHEKCLKKWWEKERSCPTCKRTFIDFNNQIKSIEFASFSEFMWKMFCVCP